MTKFTALIPARMDSSRLPGKPLKKICGIEMIVHVALRCSLLENLDRVIVCTDSLEIMEVCENYDIQVCLTSSAHKNGTERIAEAAEILKIPDNDIVVDVQGDEPFVRPEYISEAISFLENTDFHCVIPHQLIDDYDNINRVKIVSNGDQILYMSRSDIPYHFGGVKGPLKKHLSIIGFRCAGLRRYANSPLTQIEDLERIELMRLLEIGVPIGTFLQDGDSLSVDTLDDYELACRMMERDELYKSMIAKGEFSGRI